MAMESLHIKSRENQTTQVYEVLIIVGAGLCGVSGDTAHHGWNHPAGRPRAT